ncbi:MAG TPA: His-Xaa-Ser system radical SAM maturase HxsB [Candidatus Portnoybacteria bacterium]|nr:His-Xaa-Ser system radical SAM maturase HxsB [Candidatus Portnoybacteria bacterium]
MAIDLKKIKYDKLGFFRFKKIGQRYLLTNDEGGYIFLEEKEFNDFLTGKIARTSELGSKLAEKRFFKEDVNLMQAAQGYRYKKSFLFSGPALHILVVTSRCNHKCIYCHASAKGIEASSDWDMTPAIARKSLEMMFKTTSPSVVIEFQGGEPLVNWPVVKLVIEEAKSLAKVSGKKLELRLVSNFSLMDDDKYQFLIKNKVSICTSLDGPKEVHNKNRIFIDGKKTGDSHSHVIKWLKRFNRDYPKNEKKGYIWRAGALITISRFSLPYYKEIIDEYVSLGLNNIFLRALDPFGMSKNVWQKIGYSAEDFINFYRQTLDYIIEINLKGIKFEERFTKYFLTKILTETDLNMVDWRSPCGAGLGQLAYNHNGDVYTCDEGRMLSMVGDESFKLGNVAENTYQEVVSHPVVRTTCCASCLTGLPGCHDCVFQPYCGVCPIYNYVEQKNIFGQMPNNERCQISQAILGYIFAKLEDEKSRQVFMNWLNLV